MEGGKVKRPMRSPVYNPMDSEKRASEATKVGWGHVNGVSWLLLSLPMAHYIHCNPDLVVYASFSDRES